MKAFAGWAISAGLVVLAAAAANAQGAPQPTGSPHYQAASDFSGPYGEDMPAPPPQVVPPQAVMPEPEYGPGMPPSLLPPREVYAVLRENGFSPLGVPRLRGMFYTIAAVDRRGDDGRLVIDARNGQIVRFVPAYRDDDDYYGGPPRPYLPMSYLDGRPPRPPAAIPNRMASRMPATVPVPKASPVRPSEARPLAEKPAPAAPVQQSAAVQTKPVEQPSVAAPAPGPVVKPAAPAIQPTQPMPQVQDLE